MSDAPAITVRGGCHCGEVAFEVRLADRVTAHRCNCSICRASGFVGIIVPASAFTLLRGRQRLSEYTFNTGVARHWFCSQCGVKSFYRPRSNPDGYNINLNCLELGADVEVHVEAFDGQHWEAHAASLKHLSTEPD